MLHKHHVVYRRDGGPDEGRNLRLIHAECHRQHHAKDGDRSRNAGPAKPERLARAGYGESRTSGSEGAGSQQCAPATRLYVEDLCVSGLARTRLAKSVHDAGWGVFTRMLEEKANRYGRTFGKVNRWFPSSQMCSVCAPKPLSVRQWTCTCGTTHDRDLNAAINILAAGRAERSNACGGTVSLSA
ncbi:RNA-guided endonuclease TnpB family protein [Nocardia sp. NPDC052112]|uniref:RNA-guided endonuclease TnpB family protein n=1 Tax=Nocardia sp. NPDC052112 TaxID=3155646 RepID=UPI003422DB2A